jgi:hypothetical protein
MSGGIFIDVGGIVAGCYVLIFPLEPPDEDASNWYLISFRTLFGLL